MRTLLLCTLVPLTLLATPAAALDPAMRGIMPTPLASASHVTVHRGMSAMNQGDRDRDGWRGDRRRDRDGSGYTWFGDREYQGDTAWRSESFNDWWHSRPDRSMPRWLGANRETCERVYSTGAGWRC